MYLYVYFLIERFVIEHDLFDFNDERNFIIWLDMNYHFVIENFIRAHPFVIIFELLGLMLSR